MTRPQTLIPVLALLAVDGWAAACGDGATKPPPPDPRLDDNVDGHARDRRTDGAGRLRAARGPSARPEWLEHGWARPDDPARARVQQPGHRAYIEATGCGRASGSNPPPVT